jgi:hypothetical protein
MQTNPPINLRELFPELTDDQLKEAEFNIERYLAAMIRIASRLRAEGYDLSDPNLTISEPSRTIQRERSNS